MYPDAPVSKTVLAMVSHFILENKNNDNLETVFLKKFLCDIVALIYSSSPMVQATHIWHTVQNGVS